MIVGCKKGFLHIKWRGEETVKKYILATHKSPEPDYQFRFFCSGAAREGQEEMAGAEKVLSGSKKETVGEVVQANSLLDQGKHSKCCQDSDCLGGQLVTHFQSSFLGLGVRYCGGQTGVGKTWTEGRRMAVGVLVGYEGEFLKLTWEGEAKVKKFVLIKQSDAGPEYQFKFCCPEELRTAQGKCSNCQSSQCRSGSDYEGFQEGDQGLTVQYVGPDKSISHWVGEVKGSNKSGLVFTWKGKQKNSSYQLRDKTGRCFFRVFCVGPVKNNKKITKK